MQSNRIAQKLRAQIQQFSGIISPRFSKPKARFIEQMLLGIAASQDCKLSRIARALGESITLKKTEDRLSHHLAQPQLGQRVAAQIVAHAEQDPALAEHHALVYPERAARTAVVREEPPPRDARVARQEVPEPSHQMLHRFNR